MSRLLTIVTIIVTLLPAPAAQADEARENVRALYTIVSSIDQMNTAYSDGLIRFTLELPREKAALASWSPLRRAGLVAFADAFMELSAATDEMCDLARDNGMASLIEKTRCGAIAEDAAFVTEWRAAAMVGVSADDLAVARGCGRGEDVAAIAATSFQYLVERRRRPCYICDPTTSFLRLDAARGWLDQRAVFFRSFNYPTTRSTPPPRPGR
jgi:hypothetical protein